MSEAWAMNAGKAATAVGTAVIEADDELFSIASHGLGVGDTVVVDTLTGGAVGVLDEGQVYWVVDVSTNTFALSQHRNGAPVAFSSDGGADVYAFAPQYSALELRRLDSGLLTNDSGDRFGAREGIHPASDPAISVSGTTWTVENVAGVVYPALTTTSGAYRFAHPSESGSLDPADGTNDRIDALDLQVQDDDEDASGFRRARVVYVAGTPASSPSAPAVTSNSLRLGTILVPSGGSPSPSIDTLAVFTVASGGVLPVRDDTEGPSAGQYHGMVRYRQDTDQLEVWDGAAWEPLAQKGGWEDIYVDEPVTHGTTLDIPSGVYDTIRIRAVGALNAEGNLAMRINGDTTAALHQFAWSAYRLDTGAVSVSDAGDLTTWRVARWGGPTISVAEITIFDTAVSSALPFFGIGQRQSVTASARLRTLSGGNLADHRLLDSIEFAVTTATTLTADVWIEGRRA